MLNSFKDFSGAKSRFPAYQVILWESFENVPTCKIRVMFFEHLSKLHAEYVQKKLCLEQEIQSLLKETQFEEMKLDNEVQMAEIRREMERNGSETSLNEIQVWRQEHSQPEHSHGNEHLEADNHLYIQFCYKLLFNKIIC